MQDLRHLHIRMRKRKGLNMLLCVYLKVVVLCTLKSYENECVYAKKIIKGATLKGRLKNICFFPIVCALICVFNGNLL